MRNKYKTFSINQMSSSIGAEIIGLDLSQKLSKPMLRELNQAWLDYQVLFFRDQPLTPDQHVNFTKNFGELQGPGYMPTLDGYPNVYVQEYPDLYKGIVSDVDWHIDASFMDKPLKGAVLYALDVPSTGGDTAWVNLYLAYELLSKPMQRLCSSLTAVHDNFHKNLTNVLDTYGAQGYEMARKATPPNEHPLVCRHPETGKKCLFYSELMISHFKQLNVDENRALKDFLVNHIKKPELYCRFKWENHSIAFWDNRCTAHKGIFDFGQEHRLMHRVAIQGETKPKK
jgi:taurine dioxygenase